MNERKEADEFASLILASSIHANLATRNHRLILRYRRTCGINDHACVQASTHTHNYAQLPAVRTQALTMNVGWWIA